MQHRSSLNNSIVPRPWLLAWLCNRSLHLVALLVLAVAPAVAQLDQGEISGTVHDPTGSVVPGAKVTATNTKLGESRTAESGSNGYFVITNLPVGPYDVTVEARGFKSYVQEGLTLDAASHVSIEANLELGAIT
jgi:hypothetical protein